MKKEIILLVEDTKSTIELVSTTLIEKGYAVSVATNGIQALEIAPKLQPSLILLDILMPGLDGYETCKRLKENDLTKNIPVIFLSALAKAFDKVKAFQVGGVDYLSKPLEMDELLVRMHTHLSISSLQNKLKEANEKLEEKVQHRTTELEETNKQLALSVGELFRKSDALQESNLELHKAKEKAEESDRLKSAFLQNMSHEVRTPLNAISGFSQLLAIPDQAPEKLAMYSEMINESSNKLIEIITDVIEISQIHTNLARVKLTEIKLVPFINCIVDGFTEKSKTNNNTLVLNNNIKNHQYTTTTDSEKLKRILMHLIDNALKFTSQGVVKITSNLVDVQGTESLQITISDTGIGISEEMLQIIFEPFRQVETGIIRNFGGNGLGLAISKAYIKLLTGSLTVTSEVNKGTTFIVEIPVMNEKVMANTLAKNEQKYAIRTVLIAEDEYSNYQYLVELFEEFGFKIRYAENGQKAIDITRTDNSIDLILMDIKMPVMDGYTAAGIIKAFRSDLPIIAQTAYALESEKDKYIGIFDDYITKPINAKLLKQKILKYMDK